MCVFYYFYCPAVDYSFTKSCTVFAIIKITQKLLWEFLIRERNYTLRWIHSAYCLMKCNYTSIVQTIARERAMYNVYTKKQATKFEVCKYSNTVCNDFPFSSWWIVFIKMFVIVRRFDYQWGFRLLASRWKAGSSGLLLKRNYGQWFWYLTIRRRSWKER